MFWWSGWFWISNYRNKYNGECICSMYVLWALNWLCATAHCCLECFPPSLNLYIVQSPLKWSELFSDMGRCEKNLSWAEFLWVIGSLSWFGDALSCFFIKKWPFACFGHDHLGVLKQYQDITNAYAHWALLQCSLGVCFCCCFCFVLGLFWTCLT